MLASAILTAAILTTVWPDIGEVREPALSLKACEIAAYDALAGIGLPLYATLPAISAKCEPAATPEAAGFRPGWDRGIP
jgi:hypothetical protein